MSAKKYRNGDVDGDELDMPAKKPRKNDDDKLWDDISTNFATKRPSDDYEREIEWLKMNMCNITTHLYKTHKQPIPACHQSAHYIYLGVSIFKLLRGNQYFIDNIPNKKEIFKLLLSVAIYEDQKSLFLLADSDFKKSHRHLYICPKELTSSENCNGDYLVLCITSENGHNTHPCLIQKQRGWIKEDGVPSEIGVAHYGFLSLQNGDVRMTSSWVDASTTESSRGLEHSTYIDRQVNSHSTTLEMFQEYARIIAMPLEERKRQSPEIVSEAYDFIGAISQNNPLLKGYVIDALLRREPKLFAEFMNPLIIVLIKIENLPIKFKNSQQNSYNLEEVLLLLTTESSQQENDFGHKGGKSKRKGRKFKNRKTEKYIEIKKHKKRKTQKKRRKRYL
jgi:hypothetical protein